MKLSKSNLIPVYHQIKNQVYDKLLNQLNNQIWYNAYGQVQNQLRDQVYYQLFVHVLAEI